MIHCLLYTVENGPSFFLSARRMKQIPNGLSLLCGCCTNCQKDPSLQCELQAVWFGKLLLFCWLCPFISANWLWLSVPFTSCALLLVMPVWLLLLSAFLANSGFLISGLYFVCCNAERLVLFLWTIWAWGQPLALSRTWWRVFTFCCSTWHKSSPHRFNFYCRFMPRETFEIQSLSCHMPKSSPGHQWSPKDTFSLSGPFASSQAESVACRDTEPRACMGTCRAWWSPCRYLRRSFSGWPYPRKGMP